MFFLLSGCAALVPQTMDLRTGWPDGVPREAELAQVPFFPQNDYQCGPAAIGMALAHSRPAITMTATQPQPDKAPA